MLLLLLLRCLCHAQNPQEQPALRIRNSVRMVEVQVIAKDKHGNPVTDLESKDFRLFDDGHLQEVTHISVDRTAFQSSPEAPDASLKTAPLATFSNTHTGADVTTVILFDVLNTAREDQASMRTELMKSLNHLKDGTRVALLILGDDLTVISDFTESTVSLKKAAGDQFHLRAEGFGPPIIARATGNPTRDRMILQAATRAFHAEDTDREMRTIAALNVICNELARIPGRKSMVWISGGLTSAGQHRDVDATVDRFNDANIALYTVDARGVLLDPGIGADTDTNDMSEAMKDDRDETRADVLATMAASTGGVFYHNTNYVGQAIDQAFEDSSIVYVMDYYPRLTAWDGKLHKLEVRTTRPGVRLRYRESYRATPAPPRTPQSEQQQLVAIAASSLDFPGLRFSVEVLSKSGGDPFLILHVPVGEVEWSTGPGKMLGALEVWFLQKKVSGDDLFTTHWKSDLHLTSDQYATLTRSGLSLSGAFTMQPSMAKIRVLVRDTKSGKIGSVDVPAEAFPVIRSPH